VKVADKGVFTVRIDPAKKAELEKIAARMDRSRNYIVEEAIDRFLEHERWFVAQVKEGLAEMEAGNLVPHEDVKSKWMKKRDARLD
jgi:predicted transcriptional regulator